MRWPDCLKSESDLVFRPIPLIITLLLYLILPFFILSGPENADNHFVQTLRMNEERSGKYIEVDRGKHLFTNKKNYIRIFTGEEIEIEQIETDLLAYISIRGTFIDNKFIRVSNYRTHNVGYRDIASYAGLLLVFFYWVCNFFNKIRIKCINRR